MTDKWPATVLLWTCLLLASQLHAQPAVQTTATEDASEPAAVTASDAAAPDPEQERFNALRNVITSWASAWQSQMDDVYLLHYHRAFVPEGFSSREEWEAQRRSRVGDPDNIRISLREFEVVSAGAEVAVVRFRLIYSRPGYADQTWKEMRLRLDGLIWRIERENNLEVVRLPPPVAATAP